MTGDINNIIGAAISLYIFVLCCLIFISRMLKHYRLEYWLGILVILCAFPLLYLLYSAYQLNRSILYHIQIGIMIGFIFIEWFLDYVIKSDFRKVKWMAIAYVMFFFAGTGGMIGIASYAGKIWTISAIILFFIMTTLAFVQHVKTGM